MNLNDKLRVMVLEEYGFDAAIHDETISDSDLKLIQQSTNNEHIQDEIDNLFKNRVHKKVVTNVANYKKFQHLKGMAAARARLQFKSELQSLIESVKYISTLDKRLIEIVLTE